MDFLITKPNNWLTRTQHTPPSTTCTYMTVVKLTSFYSKPVHTINLSKIKFRIHKFHTGFTKVNKYYLLKFYHFKIKLFCIRSLKSLMHVYIAKRENIFHPIVKLKTFPAFILQHKLLIAKVSPPCSLCPFLTFV